jgi:hypothetical protein
MDANLEMYARPQRLYINHRLTGTILFVVILRAAVITKLSIQTLVYPRSAWQPMGTINCQLAKYQLKFVIKTIPFCLYPHYQRDHMDLGIVW